MLRWTLLLFLPTLILASIFPIWMCSGFLGFAMRGSLAPPKETAARTTTPGARAYAKGCRDLQLELPYDGLKVFTEVQRMARRAVFGEFEDVRFYAFAD
jgi:hypothetical protein